MTAVRLASGTPDHPDLRVVTGLCQTTWPAPDRMPLCVSRGRVRLSVVGWWQAREWLARRAGLVGCDPAALGAESFPCCHPGSLAWPSARLASSRRRVKTASLPEETSMGAAPLQAAKRPRFLNRETSRTSPMTVAAMTGPTPNNPVRLVPCRAARPPRTPSRGGFSTAGSYSGRRARGTDAAGLLFGPPRPNRRS